MPSFREAVSESARNYTCALTRSPDPFRNWLRGATSSIPGLGGAVAAEDDFWDNFGNLVCPADPVTRPPVYPEPDSGLGKCEGIEYRILNTYSRNLSNGTTTDPVTDNIDSLPGSRGPIFGPITGPIYTPTGSGLIQIQYVAFDRDGVQGTFPAGGGPAESINQIVWEPQRIDGNPDECGEQGPQQPPAGGDDITYDGPDGNPVTEPVDISPRFPILFPSGDVIIPFEFCFASLCIDVNFNISTGDVTFNFGGSPDAGNCCPPPKEDEQEPEEGDPPEPETTERIVGVKVNAVIAPVGCKATEITDGSGPSMYWPDLGFVRFAVEYGGFRGWTEKIAVQTASQIVTVPGDLVAYDFDIFERPGVTLTPKSIIVKVTD